MLLIKAHIFKEDIRGCTSTGVLKIGNIELEIIQKKITGWYKRLGKRLARSQ